MDKQILSLAQIRIDGGTQSRVELNNATVEEYSEAMTDGVEFPPVVVFFDGASHWLADGFHRYFGAEQAGLETITADVRKGTQLDGQLFSFGVNANHGLRRSHADKRKAVTGALQHPVSGSWSDRQIAKHCGVGNQLVGDVRRSICVNHTDASSAARTVVRNGTEYTQDTTNIGKSAEIKAREAAGRSLAAMSDDELEQTKDAIDRMAAADQTEGATEAAPSEDLEPSDEPPEYTKLDQALDLIQVLRAELAVAQMGNVSEEEKQEASRLIAELRNDIKSLVAQLQVAVQRRDELSNENAAMKSQLTRQRREIDRLKQGVAA